MNVRLILLACALASAVLVEGVSGRDGAKHKKHKQKHKHYESSTERFLGRLTDAIELIQTKTDYSNPGPLLVKPDYFDADQGVQAEAKIIGGVLVSKRYCT